MKKLLLIFFKPYPIRSSGATSTNDGVRKIDQLLELISKTSSSNVAAIDELDKSQNSLSPTKDIDDPLAK